MSQVETLEQETDAATLSGGDLSLGRFWAPKYWPVWVLWLAMQFVARLPSPLQIRTGAFLGHMLKRLRRRPAAIARRNLEICFPELSAKDRETLLDRHFRSVGLSVIEMAIGWFAPLSKLRGRVEIEGKEHLERALSGGKGVLLVGAHFTPVEVCLAALEDVDVPFGGMYRPQRNAMMNTLILRGRSRFAIKQIPRHDIRSLIRHLRRNYAIVYFPDQTYLGNQSALIPFFGEPAVTNIATTKLARLSGAQVLPFFFKRKDDDYGYTISIGSALENFPTDDPVADTRRLVALLEEEIRQCPDQYLWLYKKFKARPPPLPDVYSR